MMLLGSLVNMLAIFAGCFVGVTLGRFIPERFNSAIEKGIALCVFYIGLDGVLAGSDTLVAILSVSAEASTIWSSSLSHWIAAPAMYTEPSTA